MEYQYNACTISVKVKNKANRERLLEVLKYIHPFIPTWIRQLDVEDDKGKVSQAKGAYLHCCSNFPYADATIFICPPFFNKELTAREQFIALLHELTHFHLAPLGLLKRDEELEELVVDGIAHSVRDMFKYGMTFNGETDND